MTAQLPTHVLLCDESGNTGSDFMNEQQQVFVYAGLLLETKELAKLREAVGEVDRIYPQATEKKGWDLTKDAKGRAALARFIRSVFAMGCKPLYSIVEKKFSVSGRIVETFFDPRINPAARFLHRNDNINRKQLGLVFAELPDYYLNLYIEAFHDPSIEAFRKCVISLARAMKSRHQNFLAKALDATLSVLPEIVASELADTPLWNGRRGTGISINVGALFAFFQMADRLAQGLGNPPTAILHHQISMQRALEVVWSWAKTDQSPRVLRDGSTIHYGLRAFQSLRFVGAAEENAIRAADFLAAAVRVLMEACARGKPWAAEFDEIAALMAPSLQEWNVCHALASPAFHQQFTDALSRHA